MFDVLMRDILGMPAILIGIFAFVGLLLQKKDIATVISGALKTTMGFLVLQAGAGVLVGVLNNYFTPMFRYAFGVDGVVPNNEAIVALAQDVFGAETALIMLFGMLVNILLARVTKFKYIFLTGHHMMFMACLIAVVLITGGLSGAPLIIIGAILLGSWMLLSPAMLQRYTKQITGNDDIALGHFGSIGYFVAGFIGNLVGDKSKSTEDLKVPKQLGFLSDSSVALALTMTIMFLIVAIVAGQDFVATISPRNFIVFSILEAIRFAAAVFIVLAGVRMVIAEIVPAFKGIADKIVPEARPALDCPAVFPFAPNAVIVGFFSSFAAGLIGMAILPVFGLSVIVPGLVPHFFTGATAGVFGNATGGRRGAVKRGG